jgi:hypothetical protein
MKDIEKIEIYIQVSNNKEEAKQYDNFSQNLRYNENYRTIFELKQKLFGEDKDDEF